MNTRRERKGVFNKLENISCIHGVMTDFKNMHVAQCICEK